MSQSSQCPVRWLVGEEGSACTTVGSPALVELGTHREVPGRQLLDTEQQLSPQTQGRVWARTFALTKDEEEKPPGKCSLDPASGRDGSRVVDQSCLSYLTLVLLTYACSKPLSLLGLQVEAARAYLCMACGGGWMFLAASSLALRSLPKLQGSST